MVAVLLLFDSRVLGQTLNRFVISIDVNSLHKLVAQMTNGCMPCLATCCLSFSKARPHLGVLLIVSTFLIVGADLCTVVISAWMESLSVTHHKEKLRMFSLDLSLALE